jgi:hypothetical protein
MDHRFVFMPHISQHFKPFPKIGTPLILIKKGFGGRASAKQKEGLAAREAVQQFQTEALKDKYQKFISRKPLTAPLFKKISAFLSRQLTKPNTQGLSKEEKISQAFLKAGYDPKGPMAERLQGSFVQQDKLKGRLKSFGNGQLNTVYKGHFKDTEGKLQERIIKFETSYTDEASQPDFFKLAGINGSCSQETARNLAAKALDDMLGWNSIVPTEIGLLKHPQTQEYTVATAMQKAPGVSGYGKPLGFKPITEEQFEMYAQWKKDFEGDPDMQDTLNGLVIKHFGAYDPKDAREILDERGNLTRLEINKRSHAIDPRDPMLKNAFLKLQLQDIIMNQGDRHIGNYFIHTTDTKNAEDKETVLGIMGIDNDLLGGKSSNINKYKQSRNAIPNKVKCPPPQIPSSLCYEILNIRVDQFKETMHAYLGKEEGDAAVQRLDQVKEHVMQVLQNNLKHGEDSLLYNYHSSNSYYVDFLAVHFPEESSKMITINH